MSDSYHSIFKSASRFFTGTVLSRISGMLRDMSMAYVFGTQVSIASFMLGFRLSHLLRRLLGEGALQSAFIPEFEALRHQNSLRAFQFFRNLTALITVVLSVLILIGCAGLGALLAFGNLSPNNQEVIFLTMLMVPSVLFICLFGLNASLLQCEKSYFTSSVAPIAFNFIWILFVIFLRHLNGPSAMPYLSVGVIVACFFQWIITVPKTFSILKKNISTPLWKEIKFISDDIRKILKPLFLGMLGVSASQINNAVDALFARFAEAEGPAFLWYSIRIQQLPLALFGIAIAGAILPPLSRAIQAAEWSKYNEFLRYAFKGTIGLILPVTFLLFVVGDSCVNLIYGHGDFNSQSVAGTTVCLWAYSVGLLPAALVLILAPASYAQNNYRLPAYASLITMILNALLNTWMIMQLKMGAVSVALATSVSAWANLVFLLWALPRKGEGILNSDLLKYAARVGIGTLIASCAVVLLRNYFNDYSIQMLFGGHVPSFSHAWVTQFYSCAWQGIVFVIITILFIPWKVKIKAPRAA